MTTKLFWSLLTILIRIPRLLKTTTTLLTGKIPRTPKMKILSPNSDLRNSSEKTFHLAEDITQRLTQLVWNHITEFSQTTNRPQRNSPMVGTITRRRTSVQLVRSITLSQLSTSMSSGSTDKLGHHQLSMFMSKCLWKDLIRHMSRSKWLREKLPWCKARLKLISRPHRLTQCTRSIESKESRERTPSTKRFRMSTLNVARLPDWARVSERELFKHTGLKLSLTNIWRVIIPD